MMMTMKWAGLQNLKSKMPSVEYSFVLAGKYSVGKSSIFQRLKTGHAPDGVVEGTSTSVTWDNDDGGLDSFVYSKEVAGKKIKVSTWVLCHSTVRVCVVGLQLHQLPVLKPARTSDKICGN